MIRSKELELEMEMIRLSQHAVTTFTKVVLFIYLFFDSFSICAPGKKKMRQISINTHLCFITRSSSWAEVAVVSFVEKPKAIDVGTDKMYSI